MRELYRRLKLERYLLTALLSEKRPLCFTIYHLSTEDKKIIEKMMSVLYLSSKLLEIHCVKSYLNHFNIILNYFNPLHAGSCFNDGHTMIVVTAVISTRT